MSAHLQFHDHRNRNHKRDEVGGDITSDHRPPTRNRTSTMVQVLVWLTKQRLEMRSAFQKAGEDKRGRPYYNDDHPDDQEATEHNLGEKLPVQETDGEFDESKSRNAYEEVAQFNLEPNSQKTRDTRVAQDRGDILHVWLYSTAL